MNATLFQLDPSKMNQFALRQAAQDAINEQTDRAGGNNIKGAVAARQVYPHIFAALDQYNVARAADGEDTLRDFSGVPAPTSDNCVALGLPVGIDLSLYTAAWKANGQKVSPLNAPRVFQALADEVQKQRKIDADAARRVAAVIAPALAAAAGSQTTAGRLQTGLPATISPGEKFVDNPASAEPTVNLNGGMASPATKNPWNRLTGK